ncbi:hypothetical protein PFISCL1PPCAC_25162, partial [Pristionchus fissidentatus]
AGHTNSVDGSLLMSCISSRSSTRQTISQDGKKVRSIKCVLVGDCLVGKTCMLVTHKTNEFPSEYVPRVAELHTVTMDIGEESYVLAPFDTLGFEDHD